MASETQIGKLVIDLQLKTKALESGLNTAKKKLKEIEQNNKKLENSNKSLDASWIAMSAAAVTALAGIKKAISSAIDEYKSYTQAMESLSDVSDYTGQNLSDMSKIMDKYSSVMNKSDIAATIKNFSLMGMTIEQTDKMIQALTNSAIRNRNANYTVSEAVKVASDGYRQGLSTLSDSAGVTENLSVMLDNYAKSIGKTASQLTEMEKNQAYVNRTMYAAEPFANAMDGYLDSLAGKQGKYTQSMKDTQVAYAESLEPVLSGILETGTGVLAFVGDFIENNKELTAGITTFGVTLTGVIVIIKLAKATMALLNTTMLASPITWIVAGLALAVSAVVAYTNAEKENNEVLQKNNELTQRYNQLLQDKYKYTNDNINAVQRDKQNVEEQIALYEKLEEAKKKVNQQNSEMNVFEAFFTGAKKMNEEVENAEKNYKKLIKENGNYGDSLDELKKKQKDYTKYLEEANAVKKITKGLDNESVKNQQKEAAQQKLKINTMQKYLDVVKKGEKGTSEYQNAVKELAKAYPEAANAGGILEDVAQNLINQDSLKADSAWKSAQERINSEIAILNAAINSQSVQQQVADNLGISVDELNKKLQSTLTLYNAMAGMKAEDVPNITPVTVDTSSSGAGGGGYSNEALDNYKRQIEHKKALDQITLKEEIAMYETALRSYANTADEKMELREKIYELNKELAQKEKEILEQQTEDYEAYIQEQKNLKGAAYDVVEQTRDYDKIIRMHRNYLEQIMKDERLSLDERKEIYREELQIIRDYEQQKRDLRIEAVDNTVSQLTNAITKQLEEAQQKDKEAIDKNLEEVEKWKNARIDAINEEYDARIEAINKELDALNKAEEQKSRDEEDAEFERKKLRLEQLIAYEHDATTKANYQKELDKLVAEYQKTLDNRALQDKKDALNEQKELLQQEQDEMTKNVEDEADRQKEIYENQLTELEKYYDEQIDMAQETAEKMLLNVQQNQDQILNILKQYGNKYEITGQSLGEKLAQGINNGLSNKIQNMIQRVQDTIDANLNAKIKEWTASNYKYEVGNNKPQTTTQTINITQQNYIEQNPEMPSETYRKLNNVSQNLASELAGI